MNSDDIKKLLESVAQGSINSSDAFEELREGPFTQLDDIAKLDGHRGFRNGFSETILCEGKKLDHVITIFKDLANRGKNILGTRADETVGNALVAALPEANYDPVSRTIISLKKPIQPVRGKLSLICAGTADLSVVEEARRSAEFFGVEAKKFYDVGVAGIHRLFESMSEIRDSDVVIVVAGMEGALPSVVGGLVHTPIIAVPTSVGYGASAGGIAALLGMLSSCSEGISVVNIDNGFGAACAALRILRAINQE
jgi:pyridinium-3,5-biscarboxylic acid mononucleotide synthase